MNTTRRQFIRLVPLLFPLSALSGCQIMTEIVPPPRGGGRVQIGVVSDLRQIAPTTGTNPLATALWRPVVEGLFDRDPQGQPRAWLAETVPGPGRGVSADGRVVILRLRQGIAWEDGKPLVADDVVFTLAVGKNPANQFSPAVAAAYQSIAQATAIDAYTVQLTLVTPGADFLDAFTPLFPAHLFHGESNLIATPYQRAPFGTGPFRLAEWVPGVRLALTRSSSYRLSDRPNLEQLVFLTYPDEAAANAALAAGTSDLLLSADGQTLLPGPANTVRGLNPQLNVPPTWNSGDWTRAQP